MNTIKLFSIISSIFIMLVLGCANPGTPQGGLKDETPPKIKKSVPKANALNFKGKKISVTFDELIQVKDVSQKLVVSPPLNKAPSVIARGDVLIIQIEDTLQDNTTYTFDFADAVSDNNEGNVYPNFTVSFSTGEVVDSMQVSGHLFEAETLAPAEGILVFLHENRADSAFHTLVPVRLAKTNEEGAFTIQNVRPGAYRIYALEDANRNYKYDQPGERIAWSDSIIVPSHEFKMFSDSIGDSLHVFEKMVYTPDSLQLFLFQEDKYNQYLVKEERKEKARLDLYFNEGLDSFKIAPVNETYPDDWAIFEWSLGRDSLYIWITDSAIYNRDSLTYSLEYAVLDSMEQVQIKQDTLTFYYFGTEKKESKRDARRKKKEEDLKVEVPSLSILNLKSQLDLYSSLSFMLKSSPMKFDPEGLHLFEMVDTIAEPITYSLVQDSINYRKFKIDKRWKPGARYEFVIDSASFVDVYGYANKPIRHSFSIKTIDAYSTLYMTIQNPGKNWLVQILNSKEAVVRQASVPKTGKVQISYLNPSEYMFRIVVDMNNNRQWDEGDYELKKQPETIFYYPEKIKLRADWEHDVVWDSSQWDIFKFIELFRKKSNSSRRR